jgi:hypothetical protein
MKFRQYQLAAAERLRRINELTHRPKGTVGIEKTMKALEAWHKAAEGSQRLADMMVIMEEENLRGGEEAAEA